MGMSHGDNPTIFISYAPADDAGDTANRSGADTKSGWVTALVANLKYVLGMRMGAGQPVEFCQGRKGSIPGVSSDEGVGKWSDARAFVIVVSQLYLKSKEHRRTLGLITTEILKRGEVRPPVFVVELSDERNREDFPRELERIKGYRFWVPAAQGRPLRQLRADAEENEYFDRVNALGFDLALALTRAKSSGRVLTPAQGVTSERPTVFLAEVVGDLELDDLRDDVQRHLDVEGLTILPAPRTLYPRDVGPFLDAIRSDLRRSSLYVQLLGKTAGAKPPGSPQSYAVLQHQCARELRKPILQWRSSAVRLDATIDPDYRKKLEGPAIMASDLKEFREELIRRIRELTAPPEERTAGQVFVNAAMNDWGLAEDVSRILEDGGCSAVLPPRDDRPSTILKELEEAYRKSDGLLFTREHSGLEWLQSNLDYWAKVQHQHKRSSKARAVALLQGPKAPNKAKAAALLQGPEAPKQAAAIIPGSAGTTPVEPNPEPPPRDWPEVKEVIDCRGAVKKKHLSKFLDALKDPDQS
jgi:hypothetical protein